MRPLRRPQPARPLLGTDPASVYLRWIWWRAVLHRGWWLVTSVYLVVDARLSGSQLVLIGVAQAITGLACEVPAGAIADAISRKWSLVASQLLMGTAMLAAGLVTDFPALVATADAVGCVLEPRQWSGRRLDHRRAGRPDPYHRRAGALRVGRS